MRSFKNQVLTRSTNARRVCVARLTTTRVPIALVVLGLVLSACSIPTDEAVQPLPTEGRQDLINGTTTSSIAPDIPEENVKDVRLYFVGSTDQLERVVRAFPSEVKVPDILAALVQGPTSDEVNLTSRITSNLAPTSAGYDEETETQTIKVSSEANLRQTVEQEPAIARLIVSQIVCTVVNLRENISGVRLIDETDEPIEVNDDLGQLITGSARASHFNDCKTGQDILEEQIEFEQNESTSTTSG